MSREKGRVEGDELVALLTLLSVPGLGLESLRGLLRRYGSPTEALDAPADELGLEAATARKAAATRQRVEAALRAIEAESVNVLLDSDREYPRRFAHLHQPPPVLFARGDLSLLRRPAAAIVGSRAATEVGRRRSAEFGAMLARAGAVVVSGFARGIDGAAHRGALDAGGATIAVLGAGIDVRYPRQHNRMRAEIAATGLLLSEFMPGEPPMPHHFPRRNRLIAAQAAAIICIEAAEKSGALNTVKHALELGRSVLVLRGPAGSKNSAGTDQLIADGATVLNRTEDVFEDTRELRRLLPRLALVRADAGPPPPLSPTGQRVYDAVGYDGMLVDSVAAAAGVDPGQALATLLELELDGRVCQLPGGRYVRAGQA